VRTLTIVPHQKAVSIFETPIKMHNRQAPALIAGNHPVARLQYKTAFDGHCSIVPHGGFRGACPQRCLSFLPILRKNECFSDAGHIEIVRAGY
jgi:hypothetical protein